MAVTSGSVGSSQYKNLGIRCYWERTGTSGTSSTIRYRVVSEGSKSGYYTSGPITVTINGSTVYNQTGRINLYSGTELKAWTSMSISHGGYDTEKSFTISISAAIYTFDVNCTGSQSFTLPGIAGTAPTAPTTVSTSAASIKPDGSATISWSGHNKGSYTINHFCVDARKYTASAGTWGDYDNIGNWNSTYATTFNSSTTSVTIKGRTLDSTFVPGDKFEFRVTMNTTKGGYLYSSDTATVTAYKDGKIMVKDVNGTVREITRIKVKDTGGTVRDITKVKVKDTSGTVHNIDLYWK